MDLQLIGMISDFFTGSVPWMKMVRVKDVIINADGSNRNTLSLESEVLVSNPYPAELPIYELSYRIMSGDREISSGIIPNPGSIQGNEYERTIKLPFTIQYDFIISILRGIGAAAIARYPILRSIGGDIGAAAIDYYPILQSIGADGDLDYELIVNLIINLPNVGKFTMTFSKKATLKLPTFPDT